MRDFLKSTGRKLSASWYWPLVLLALPACAFQTGGIPLPSDNTFDPGTGDLSSAVMCDIPKFPDTSTRDFPCASPADVAMFWSTAHAAVALADGTQAPSNFVLDYSQHAQQLCGAGVPQKIELFGPFPDGTTVCLNCAQQIPAKFSGPAAVCVAKCKELISTQGTLPPGFCEANAKVSTNFAPNICFTNACTNGGTPNPNFSDPRRIAEPVKWTDLSPGVSPSGNPGNTLQRTAPTTGPAQSDFNEGAASGQLITHGDAWVEFEANDNTLSQVLGVRQSCADITACPDTDPSLKDIGFSLILNSDQNVYVIESNPAVTVHGSLGTYVAHERFRVHVVDNNNGTATISYTRVVGPCAPGTVCNETKLFQSVATPNYPLRIDASFREQNATLANVTVMRIQ